MAVTVIGIDGGPLPEGATEVLNSAALVVGAPPHLREHAPEGARTVELGSFGPALNALSALTASETGVVLASGDPGYFGAVRALRDKGVRCSVMPALSSVQRLLARMGRSWEDTSVVSARIGGLHRALNVCRARSAVVVLTGGGIGPAQLASGLRGWRRTMIVGEDLGGEHERVTTVDPEEAAERSWFEPNIVCCLDDPDAVPDRNWHSGGEPTPPRRWALPEEEFSHREGTITSAEVRALALARLRPRPGALVWDVGAGSGSVAVECARMGAACVAVESDEAQVVRLVSNAAAHGVDVRVEEGAAPAVLRGLAKPDSVFVGIDDAEVLTACAHVGATRVVLVLSALDRIGASRDVLRNAGYHVEGVQLSANRMFTSDEQGPRLSAVEPVVLLSAELPTAENE
ncbi:precorrin-6Y C5,15-methyltransferase (decarboxylating) [Actinopolyspora xinjiangensis]|uniref:Precorrin-6Y C5,15-methyltransferase (Decarboxylating) n=1 Tax=Actinopolyspora xinjiangensis TaxID=405564 RepID=A0A1H0SX78_9ACTN|nr:precorrin-6y C5,15-methyltransferase (decarboxylating) subunit CbiE [Actinopolyspora xinjiangensis]SDP46264.1 precorrin-6Y C5,15-methyltransferase (decarboxylating) [Actinopolyspora xinjiangensis]